MAYDIATIGDLHGRAPCSCCAACSTTYRGPHDALERMSAHAAGVGGETMGRFGVFRADVDALKRDIHPSMLATEAAVSQCQGVTPGERTAWGDFFKAWKSFHDEETPLIIGVGRRYDEAIEFRNQLIGWQETLRAKCTIPGPLPTLGAPEDGGMASAVKLGAIAAIVIAGVYVASPLVEVAQRWASKK